MTIEVRGKLYRTAWKHHEQKWNKCTDCHLHSGATKKVLLKGSIPCDILFIGEAPDTLESVIGLPFSNPAGKLMSQLVDDTEMKFSHAFTNVIACPSTGSEGETRPPTSFEVTKCSPRLLGVFKLAKPKGIILLGRSSQSFAIPTMEKYQGYPYKHLNLSHPSHMLRMGGRDSTFYTKELKLLITFLKRILDDEKYMANRIE